jgi:N-carbamoyl-L-amino-acid hydrolase
MDLAQFGARPDGGVNRQALSPEDIAGRAQFITWCEEQGYACSSDAVGNLFVRRAGTDPYADPVLTGSHLDSQPTGGKFDGAFGVLAGLEALQALDDTGIITRRPVEVVAWTNEEGSRFQPGCMGSSVFIGATGMEDILGCRDRDGVLVADALAQTLAAAPNLPRRSMAFPIAAYVECHIEQGPILEQAGKTIGIVTGIQGYRWFAVEVRGQEAHSGTTPRRAQKDALKAASAMVNALETLMIDESDTLRFTIGRFEVEPGSPNVVPGRVFFTIDMRHPDQAVLAARAAAVEATCRAAAGTCEVTVTQTFATPPIAFDGAVVDLVAETADRLGLPSMRLGSGAGHDAGYMARVCPSAMIFVPCEKGISHHPAEFATSADLAAGTRVLADMLADLANR